MKTQSQQAQVSKIIRQHCKKIGIKCRVTSKGYSGGNSVNVTVYNQPPAVFNALKKLWAKYQYGHFDGMTDCYEYSNNREDIPQTRFLFIDNDFSKATRQAAWDLIRATYADAHNAPEHVDESSQVRIFNDWGDIFLFKFLNGTIGHDTSDKFWNSRDTKKDAA